MGFIVILLVLLLIAVLTDFSKARIPNIFICFGLLFGAFYRFSIGGPKESLLAIAGMLLPILILFPLFLIRAMGAGDIKLLAVTGAFLSFSDNLKLFVFSVCIGAVIAVGKMIWNHNLFERLKYFVSYFFYCFLRQRAKCRGIVPYVEGGLKEIDQKNGIHFSFPILLAAIVVLGGKI